MQCVTNLIFFFGAISGIAACLAGSPAACADAANADITLKPAFAVTSFDGSKTFLTPQALCVDAERGDVYVADTNNGRIVVFNADGQFVTSFKHSPVRGERAEPVGVAVDKTGRVYVTDSSSHAIYIYDLRGRLIDRIESQDDRALFGRMAVDGAGNLYVTVRSRGRVLKYDLNKTLALSLGDSKGSERLEMVSDVAVDSPGRILALSSLGTAVHIYDAAGRPLLQFGQHSPGPENVAFPTSIDVDAQGRIWVTDSVAGAIKIYTSSGKFIKNIGGLNFPVDLAIWQKGKRVFVLEKNARRLSSYVIDEGGPKS